MQQYTRRLRLTLSFVRINVTKQLDVHLVISWNSSFFI